jgi:hypothetical protein
MHYAWIQRHKGTLLIIASILGMLACDYFVSKFAGAALGEIADKTVFEWEGGGSAGRIIGSPFELERNVTSVNGVPPYVYHYYMAFPENIGKNEAYYMDIIFAGLMATEGWALVLYELFTNRKRKRAHWDNR